jgi:hypothetical protein
MDQLSARARRRYSPKGGSGPPWNEAIGLSLERQGPARSLPLNASRPSLQPRRHRAVRARVPCGACGFRPCGRSVSEAPDPRCAGRRCPPQSYSRTVRIRSAHSRAVVCVGDHRHADGLDEAPCLACHFGDGQEPDVWASEQRRRSRVAHHVDSIKSRLLDQTGRMRLVGAAAPTINPSVARSSRRRTCARIAR